jgi:hypothetical protein
MVPDEDEVHFALTWNLAHELGFDENSDEEVQLATVPWSIDVAKRAVTAISPCFGMDARQIELAAAHLNAMIEPVVQVWDGDVYFFHPDGNDVGWASPNWVRKLISLDGGYEIYRGHMDHFVRCMKGASPEDCPAGFEAFKGRIVEPFGFNGGQVEIMGCGTIADPFECYSNFDAYTGDEWSLDPDFINEVRYSRQMRALAG